MATNVQINIASAEFKANPYPFYQRLRAESPVVSIKLPDKQTAWLITRYDDVLMILKDERVVKNRLNAMTPEQLARQPWMPAMFKPLARNMLDLDAPDHTRLRALVQKAFTARLIEQLRARIESLTDNLLDRLKNSRQADLISDYALPLPTVIIAEMLGVPVHAQGKFHRWSKTIVSANSSDWGMIRAIPAIIAFMRYIRKLIKLRRADPRDDLTSALLAAEEAGERLNEDELVAMIFLLLVAGHETTVNLIGNGVLALLENPAQLDRLKREPALIKTGIEELLRYHSPLETATERYAREEIFINNINIPRGALIYAVIASANRDERQFDRPDVLDITRDPNRHLSFGQGRHYCLGAPLARLEGQIAINKLLLRVPDLRLAIPHRSLKWRRGLVLRGLEALPVLLK